MISMGPVTCGTGGSDGFTYGTGALVAGGAGVGAGAGAAGAGPASGMGAVVAGAVAQAERLAIVASAPRSFLVVVIYAQSSSVVNLIAWSIPDHKG